MARKPKVLAVDDKRANQLGLDAVLGADCDLIFAYSGEEALELLAAQRDIDLILMDVQMPGMDGFETAALIKEMEGAKDIPIIFVTAIYTEDPFVKKGYAVGGIDYFGKPFDPEILRMKVAIYASFRLKAQFLQERERHIRESEGLLRVGRKFNSVLETLPVGVLIADVEGRICQMTQEVSRLLDTTGSIEADAYGDILGWWDTEGRTLKNEDGPLTRAVRKGESSHSERLQIRRLDGTVKTIVASASPLRGLDQRIVGAVILLQDLTESSQIEDELAQRVTKLVSLGIELEESAAP